MLIPVNPPILSFKKKESNSVCETQSFEALYQIILVIQWEIIAIDN